MSPTDNKPRRARRAAARGPGQLGHAARAGRGIADFYKGKTVSLVVGSSTGGGYDTMTRAVGRFIGRHIPGNPTVVVRNMPGAGGITAMNYIYNAAERDGTVLALVQNNTPLEPLVRHQAGALRRHEAQLARHPELRGRHGAAVAHGAGEFARRICKSRETQMGASGANSTPAFYTRLLNATLGTRMKLVNGYPGQNEALLAMERGELDGYPSVFQSALTSTRPTWLADKLAKAIVQYGPERLTELGDVPFAPDLLRNEDDKLLMQVGVAPLALGRPLVMPPDVPPERVAAMREALADTFADPEFLAEGERMGLAVNAPRTGAQLQDVIARAYQSPPRIIERLQKLNNP